MHKDRGWDLIGATGLWCIAFYATVRFPRDWLIVIGILALYFYGILGWWTGTWGHVLRKRAEYREKGYIAPVQERKPDAVPLSVDGNLVGMLSYEQITTMPAFDPERNFAKTLITMRNGNLRVNMTETYWIAGGKYGDSREAFVNMREKWIYHNIARKVGTSQTSTYEIVNEGWRVVRQIADGLKLSPPPLAKDEPMQFRRVKKVSEVTSNPLRWGRAEE